MAENILDGVKGKYEGIDYVWFTDTTSKIRFMYDGNEIILDTGKLYNIPDRIDAYNVVATWMIKSYINSLNCRKEMQKIIGEKENVK